MLKALLITEIALLVNFFNPLLGTVFTIVALLFLAYHLGEITEELARHFSPIAGGLISSTLGNAVELLLSWFALQRGLTELVKASITGSILGNLLFVFGLSAFLGGLKYEKLEVYKKSAELNATVLLLAVLLLLFPSMLDIFHEKKYELPISELIAVIMLLLYFGSLVFSFLTHRHWFLEKSKEKPKKRLMVTIIEAIILVLAIAVLSEPFAGHLETLAHDFGLGELFIGVVILGLVGNIAEHLAAVQFALKGKMNLVVSTTIGSSLQVVLFVTPFLVLVSLLVSPMSLVFEPLEIVSSLTAVLLLNEILRDGEVTWIEGLELLLLYVVIISLFYFA